METESLPDWVKVDPFDRDEYRKTYEVVKEHGLNTVCIEANCPNRYECFSRGTATFMILGDTCTRSCRYCDVKSGKPSAPDADEPERIGKAVKKLGLRHAVITCVTRDDLPDGGASYFVNTVKAIRKSSPTSTVELLISDLDGNWDSLKTIVDSKPDVLDHNIEVVEQLFPRLRPIGSYRISLELLKRVKETDPGMATKSGLMVGLGETKEQIIQTMEDLRSVGCDILTIGQYLQPSKSHASVERYLTPEEFKELEAKGKEVGFRHVLSGPLVRSSYRAESCMRGPR